MKNFIKALFFLNFIIITTHPMEEDSDEDEKKRIFIELDMGNGGIARLLETTSESIRGEEMPPLYVKFEGKLMEIKN
jgi:hypothetical protein